LCSTKQQWQNKKERCQDREGHSFSRIHEYLDSRTWGALKLVHPFDYITKTIYRERDVRLRQPRIVWRIDSSSLTSYNGNSDSDMKERKKKLPRILIVIIGLVQLAVFNFR
jgi:hypothetical protein